MRISVVVKKKKKKKLGQYAVDIQAGKLEANVNIIISLP